MKDRRGDDFELIYPKEKYNEEMSPICNYIPSNKILLTMFRMAILCKSESETFFAPTHVGNLNAQVFYQYFDKDNEVCYVTG